MREPTKGDALALALAFAGEPQPAETEQPFGETWQVQLRRGRADEADYVTVYEGTRAEALARYEKEKGKLKGGSVQLLKPSGGLARRASSP